jgi:UDP-glucose:(heptosyl)LPS alpha-1,3-glucosyltransferase
VLGLGRADRQDVYRVGGGSHLAHLRAMKPWTRARWGSTLIRLDPRHGTFLALERRILQGWRRGRTLRYLCNARRVRDEIIADYGVPPERIDVLHNPVDTARFRPGRWLGTRSETRRALGLPEETYVLLFAGSGFERKGLDTAIRAVAASGGQARLLVAGGGDQAPYRALARDLRIEGRVVFVGRRPDIERIYAASDAFLLPTRYDAFANATTEALAMGLPAITTGMNGASEVITEGREGFIVPIPDDVENFGLAVKRLAAPALRAEMAEWARKRAEMLCPSAYAGGVVKVLEAAIAMRGGGA